MPSFPTVLIPFDGRLADAVDDVLDDMRNPARTSIRRPLDEVGTVHFMSMSVVRGAGPLGAFLVLEATVDGGSRPALRQIAAKLEGPLTCLLSAAGLWQPSCDIAELLIEHDHSVGPSWLARALGLCFAGTPGMTVSRIRKERELARRIADMDDLLASDKGALDKLQEVQATLREQGDVKWAFNAEPMPWVDGRPRAVFGLAARVGVLLCVLVGLYLVGWKAALAVIFVLLLVAAAVAVRLRYLERTDVPDDAAPDARRVSEAMDRENVGPQNLLVAVCDMKPGVLRRLALRAAFSLIGQMAAKEYRPGFLATIGTIHSARWVVLPGTGKLVFLANYSGSLESYLEDFIQSAHQGVTGIWSNAKGFPRTRWLFLDGARDGDRFRRYVLRKQVPARFWYSAYPRLTTARIRTNAVICNGIAAAATEDEAEAWLACFGSSGRMFPARRSARPIAFRGSMASAFEWLITETRPVPRVPLEERKIPTLVFGARRHLQYSACLMVRLADDPERCRAWLRRLAPEVTYGAEKQDRALVLAFAASAFSESKLALPSEAEQTFPPAFRNGMDAPCRARALGDRGRNAPKHWDWGSGPNPVDALVIVYDSVEGRLESRLGRIWEDVLSAGHTVAYHLSLLPLPPSGQPLRETFGFVDGLSQPVIRDAAGEHATGRDTPQEAGEFVLGYRDNGGFLPPSPTVAARHDPSNLLSDLQHSPGTERDLGRNGTFLAVRQLAQDPDGFDAWLRKAACAVGKGRSSLSSVPAPALEELIAAKLMGRWRNGTALAQHPASPGNADRNDFLYGSVDPSGVGCPFGAHVRRANPRDSFEPGSDRQLTIADRHRILRVGRRYGPTASGRQPGLLFLGVNADIGRQFEFIQQTWLLGRSFSSLEDEDDPLLGQGCGRRRFTVHTQHGPLRLRMPSAPGGFVTVVGGGYFFMPGRDALRFLAER